MSVYQIKSDNIIKVIDTDDYICRDLDAILDSEIHYLRKEEGMMFGTTSFVVEVEEIA